MILPIVVLAVRNTVRRRRQVVLVALTIVVGVAVATIQRGLVEGVRERMVDHIVVSRFGHVRVAPVDTEGGQSRIEDPAVVREVILATAPGAQIVPRLSALGMAFSGTEGTARIAIHGTTSGPPAPRTVSLGAAVADRLGVSEGDPMTVSVTAADGIMESGEFAVAAVHRDTAPWEAYFVDVPLADLQELLGVGSAVQFLDVVLPEGETAAAPTASRLAAALPGYRVQTYRETGALYMGIVSAARIQAGIIEVVLLLAVGLAVAGAQLLQVHGRRQEIGTMVALGTPVVGVRLMILLEGALLSVFGGAVGVAVGLAGIAALQNGGIAVDVQAFRWMVGHSHLTPKVDATGIAWTLALLSVVVAACGLHPASRAARQVPAETLRDGS